VKARVAQYEDPGGQLIIRREGTRIAFVVLDPPPGSFSATAAQLTAEETEHWGAAKRGSREGSSSRPSTVASCPSIFASFPLITDPIEPSGWCYLGRQRGLPLRRLQRRCLTLEADEPSWRAPCRSEPRGGTGWLTSTASERPRRRVPPLANSKIWVEAS
jgi:hypothetical protein